MQYYPYYFMRPEGSNQFVNKLEKAINGEFSAIACYKKLAKMAPSDEIRETINEIRQDEIRHYQGFLQMYASLTGLQLTPKISEECPDSYEKGLEFAFKDEQKTVHFYLQMADEATDVNIKEQFRRAAVDEQNHAVWFLFFMMDKD